MSKPLGRYTYEWNSRKFTICFVYIILKNAFQVTGHSSDAELEYKRTSLNMQQSGYLAISALFIDSVAQNCKTEKRKVSMKKVKKIFRMVISFGSDTKSSE